MADDPNLTDASEMEKLRALVEEQRVRLEQLGGAAEKAQRYDEMIAQRREEALGKLPEAVRTRLASAIEGLDADRSLALIEAAGLASPPSAAPFDRSSPARPTALPTLADLERDPNLIMTLKPEDRAAVLASRTGIRPGGGTLFGR